ncbi:hypothetical protein [Pseudobutyrivibrio sp.]|uniref:hypothetical protein n=1 Tax=Pseudobutyrivibrio sp. TaxID=2014367 RepID=UPI00386B93FF
MSRLNPFKRKHKSFSPADEQIKMCKDFYKIVKKMRTFLGKNSYHTSIIQNKKSILILENL